MSEVNALFTMCTGSALLSFVVMLLASNIARLVRYALSSEDE